jgi:hypothetical protein
MEEIGDESGYWLAWKVGSIATISGKPTTDSA